MSVDAPQLGTFTTPYCVLAVAGYLSGKEGWGSG